MATSGSASSAAASAWAAERKPSSAGAADLVLPRRQRHDPDAAAHQYRSAPVLRAGEADPERAGQPHAVAGPELGQPVRARPDVLEQELQPPVARPQERERAWQEGSTHGFAVCPRLASPHRSRAASM